MSYLARLARKHARLSSRPWRAIAAFTLGLVALQPCYADLYRINATVTLCTGGTCDSFAALDVGSRVDSNPSNSSAGECLSEDYGIATTPGGAWNFSGMGGFSFDIFNPAAPLEPYDGTNATTANPLPITPDIAPLRASGGGLTTAGTTGAANELNAGTILHEFVVPPFDNNGAWIVFDIGAGGITQMQICLFFPTAGCIPGATQAVVADGGFTLVSEPGFDPDNDGWINSCDHDNDGDGIRDAYDIHFNTPDNVCTGGDPDNATLAEIISGYRICGAKDSVQVQAPTHVLSPDGYLRVISERVEIQSGVAVEEKFIGIAKDPCPAELPGCN